MQLTKRQAEALQFIQEFTDTHPYSPSLREISAGLGLKSVSPAKSLVDALAEKNYIHYQPGSHRSIRVTK